MPWADRPGRARHPGVGWARLDREGAACGSTVCRRSSGSPIGGGPLDHLAERAGAEARGTAMRVSRFGRWVPVTCEQLFDEAITIAKGIAAAGVQPGDRIAIALVAAVRSGSSRSTPSGTRVRSACPSPFGFARPGGVDPVRLGRGRPVRRNPEAARGVRQDPPPAAQRSSRVGLRRRGAVVVGRVGRDRRGRRPRAAPPHRVARQYGDDQLPVSGRRPGTGVRADARRARLPGGNHRALPARHIAPGGVRAAVASAARHLRPNPAPRRGPGRGGERTVRRSGTTGGVRAGFGRAASSPPPSCSPRSSSAPGTTRTVPAWAASSTAPCGARSGSASLHRPARACAWAWSMRPSDPWCTGICATTWAAASAS